MSLPPLAVYAKSLNKGGNAVAENTYYDYINAFYDLLQVNPITSNAQLLYYTLLMIFNKAHWVHELQRTNYNICSLCGIGEKALTSAKNELKQLGLIDFISPKKKPTIYRLCTVKMEGQTQVKGKSKESQTQVKGRTYKDKREKNKDLKTVTPVFPSAVPQNIIDLYEENISRNYITRMELDNLEFWLARVDADMLEWAIKEAAGNNKRTWKYIEAILNNHFSAGRTTLAAVQDAQSSFKAQKDQAQSVYSDDNYDYDELEEIMREKM